MRLADHPWAETDAESADRRQPDRSDGLADRLSRLAAAHPSAGADEPAWDGGPAADDLGRDDLGVGELGESDLRESDLGEGDLGEGDLGARAADPGSGDAAAAAAGARRPRLIAAASTWGELAAPGARTPYRPWFGADGAGDPWFAAGFIE